MNDNRKLFSLTVLGTRGSMSVTGEDKTKYGCGTSSYLVETEDETIILDAGSGIQNFTGTDKKRVSLLITHAHIDHIMGMPMILGACAGKDLWIYGATRGGVTIKQQLETYMRPPLWPVGFEVYPVDVEFRGISSSFNIGNVKVTSMESNHPGGSTIFALEYDGRKIVYATDFEHGQRVVKLEDDGQGKGVAGNAGNSEIAIPKKGDVPAFARLAEFSRDADLLLYDAQYTTEEYKKCRGFGHSTYVKALELYELSGAKDMLLVHHAPTHTDAFMDSMAADLAKAIPDMKTPCRGDIHFALEGEKIEL